MFRYFFHISKKILIWIILFWLLCYTINSTVEDEWTELKPVGNYWLNEDTSKILQIKVLNYDTHLIEYRDTSPAPDYIRKSKFNVKSKETDLLNGDIDYYELYEYYHD